MTSSTIDGTSITIDSVLKGMSISRDNLKSYSVKNITNGSAFLSHILKLSFEWHPSPESEESPPSSVILKVPTMDNLLTIYSDAHGDNPQQDSEAIAGELAFISRVHNVRAPSLPN